MKLTLEIHDAADEDVGLPRSMHATWHDSPQGKVGFIWGTKFEPHHLDDPDVRAAAERHIRAVYSEAYSATEATSSPTETSD